LNMIRQRLLGSHEITIFFISHFSEYVIVDAPNW
jgi:hypothetical protein